MACSSVEKPFLTICLLSKSEICSLTMTCLLNACENEKLKSLVDIQQRFCIGQSDLPKARSLQVTQWYEQKTSQPGDFFMFIDADQTFLPSDVIRSVEMLLNNNTTHVEVVCGAYARKNGNMTVEAEYPISFVENKQGPLLYGATGFMMFTYNIIDRMAKDLFEGKKYKTSIDTFAYPFFFERIVDDLWLSEDYSFCHLVNKECGKIVYGWISPSLGHIIPTEKYVQLPGKKVWPTNSIVIYCHGSPKPWSPMSLKEGIGGSETSVIHLSQEWVKQGYEVTVFCDCSREGNYEGVEYRNKLQFHKYDHYNIFICWRNLKVLATNDIKARRIILDLHDLIKPEYLCERLVEAVDVFAVKSHYHSIPLLNYFGKEKIEQKLSIIPNGGACNFAEFQTIEKDVNYLIYTSSYDRGLYYMLRYGWPVIKKACPNAIFKLFYGWETFDIYAANQPEKLLFKQVMQELMKQDGVYECGKVSQESLMREKQKANIHYYVGNFQEIDCISVRESASVGAIPVVSAFVEVFQEKDYCLTIQGNPEEQKTQEAAAEVIINLLKDQEKANKIRTELKAVVEDKQESWDMIAKKWIGNNFTNLRY